VAADGGLLTDGGPVSYTHLDVYKRQLRGLQQDRKAALQQAVEEVALLTQLAASKGETYDFERD